MCTLLLNTVRIIPGLYVGHVPQSVLPLPTETPVFLVVQLHTHPCPLPTSTFQDGTVQVTRLQMV